MEQERGTADAASTGSALRRAANGMRNVRSGRELGHYITGDRMATFGANASFKRLGLLITFHRGCVKRPVEL
jgi:hypothetical protein